MAIPANCDRRRAKIPIDLARPALGVALLLAAVGCSAPPARLATESVAPKATETAAATRTAPPSPTALLASATPTPGCQRAHGRIEQRSYRGAVVKDDVPVLVYLPPCYRPSAGPFPSLILLHGFPFDETHWLDLGVVEAIERGLEEEGWPPFVAIMPYLPQPLFTGTDGGPGSYEAEMMEGLLPFIEAEYAIDPRAGRSGLAGISRGGVWALEIGLRHAERFDALAALSPALSVNYPRPKYDPFIILRGEGPFPSHLLLTAGTGEPGFYEAAERMAAAMEKAGLAPVFLETDGGHNAAGWEPILMDVLRFFTVNWKEAPF